ncbi:cucumisin-like isoform X2 [Phoenix dactylifera]|nr:cucumisin-like isoform X2 [Phoenix dactylifera]
MGDQNLEDYSAETLHLNLLDQVLESSSARECLVYSYKRSFNGFAAKLMDQERKKLAGMGGIVSVFPSRTLKLHTTRSWDFLGFTKTARRNLALERDVIVGMFDTGIWPEAKSFSNEGLGPPPKRWKGACLNFTCNNKIIGARYYHSSVSPPGEELSARDFQGHGSHTASTVAGHAVGNASLYNLASGTARGAVPSARIAVYKICWEDRCKGHDILAAFDDAIADGVDIISISIGFRSPVAYFEDPIAIGSFHAMKKGILTSASAGNEGPGRGTASNVAPWILVAAASTIDRHFIDKLFLGNSETIVGSSVNTFPTEKRFYPLLISLGDGNTSGSYCDLGSLNESQVRGKIILCPSTADGSGPLKAGAKGMVMIDKIDDAFTYPLPALVVPLSERKKLIHYSNNARKPVANIHKSEEVLDPKAPTVAAFSSRGPNNITKDILKPDISAPGVDILAAWSPKAMVSDSKLDTRSVKYNIISGTSMACPHVTGIAAYVRSFHPTWSPAAIMSALITTASPMNPSYHSDAELAYGAGQVNPRKARSPGLVYDATARDYAEVLCHQGYNKSMIRRIAGDEITCPKNAKGSARDLNYPSMAAYVHTDKSFRVQFPRTVTNVGHSNSRYTARINSSSKLNVTVNPKVLSFTKLYEKQKFVVTVSGGPLSFRSVASASIIWSDGNHQVRSPICVHTDYNRASHV